MSVIQSIIRSIHKNAIVGITSGCFDLLHPMHIRYLEKCKNLCDILIVLVDSNYLIKKNKNKTPVFDEEERNFMIASLKIVDYSTIMNDLTDLEFILTTASADNKTKLFRSNSTIYGTKCIKVKGVETVIIPDVELFKSTTEIINYVQSLK